MGVTREGAPVLIRQFIHSYWSRATAGTPVPHYAWCACRSPYKKFLPKGLIYHFIAGEVLCWKKKVGPKSCSVFWPKRCLWIIITEFIKHLFQRMQSARDNATKNPKENQDVSFKMIRRSFNLTDWLSFKKPFFLFWFWFCYYYYYLFDLNKYKWCLLGPFYTCLLVYV